MTDATSTHTPLENAASPSPPLDTPALLEHCLGNTALVAMLFDTFEKQATGDLIRIEMALAAADTERVSRCAHALKGAAGALSATAVQRTAALIELAARENRLEAATAGFRDLKIEVDRCLAYLPTARGASKNAPPKSHP